MPTDSAHPSVRAVDRDLVSRERDRRGAHRIMRRAARDQARKLGMIAGDDGRRRPIRRQVLAFDGGLAKPGFAGLADCDRIADCLAVSFGKVELALVLADDDFPGRIIAAERNDFARRSPNCKRRQTGRSPRTKGQTQKLQEQGRSVAPTLSITPPAQQSNPYDNRELPQVHEDISRHRVKMPLTCGGERRSPARFLTLF